MRNWIALPLAAALTLAACGDNEADEADAEAGEGMSGTDMATAMADAPMPRPGQYRSTQELLELDIPGAPEQVLNMMRGAFEEGAQAENTYCITEEEAANSRQEMLEGMAESDCTVERFDVSGGTIDGLMSCPTGDGVTGDLAMTGTMSEEGADMVMTFDAEVPQMGKANIRMRVVSERIGECS